MGIRAPKAKGRDPNSHRVVSLVLGHCLAWDFDLIPLIVYVRIHKMEVDVGQGLPVLHHKGGLDESSHPRAALGVPLVALHRGEQQVVPGVNLCQGAELDGVTHERAVGRALQAAQRLRVHAGDLVAVPQQRRLRRAVRGCERGAFAVLVHAAARDDRGAVGQVRAPGQDQRAVRLATGVAVGTAVEGKGPPAFREELQHAAVDEGLPGAHVADA
mmetsp:Transcript_183740/g.447367  ORF Transcript_183740/g.447367 Transcript_183740/m.447367 type:complete len:215 (-) Transcript_183740:758-1402(-)